MPSYHPPLPAPLSIIIISFIVTIVIIIIIIIINIIIIDNLFTEFCQHQNSFHPIIIWDLFKRHFQILKAKRRPVTTRGHLTFLPQWDISCGTYVTCCAAASFEWWLPWHFCACQSQLAERSIPTSLHLHLPGCMCHFYHSTTRSWERFEPRATSKRLFAKKKNNFTRAC